MKKQINTDFQEDIAKNTENTVSSLDDTNCKVFEDNQEVSEKVSNKKATTLDCDLEESNIKQIENDNSNDCQSTNVDIDKKDYQNENASQQVADTADVDTANIANKNCNLNKAKLDKIKNWYFGAIPFILVAIVISLFNIGKVRHPLSYLFLALGLLHLAITNFIISKKIAKVCTCKNCKQQSKSSFKFAIIFGVATLGLLGLFIFFMVK